MGSPAGKRAWHLALAVAVVVLAAACGAGDDDDPASATAPSAPTGDVAVEAAQGVDGWSNVVRFNEALAAQDWTAAEQLAVPGSPASQYVDYRRQVTQAQEAAGMGSTSTADVLPDEDSESLTVRITTGDDTVTYTWTGFETDEFGLVSTWSTAQGPLEQQLVTGSAQDEGAGATVAVTSAYRTDAGDLYVVVSVTATDDVISVDTSPALRRADGTSQEAEVYLGPSGVEPGQDAVVLYVFEGASRQGTLVYEVQNSYDAPLALELPLV